MNQYPILHDTTADPTVTQRFLRRAGAVSVSALLAVSLLSACGDDERAPVAPTTAAATPEATTEDTETTPSPEPTETTGFPRPELTTLDESERIESDNEVIRGVNDLEVRSGLKMFNAGAMEFFEIPNNRESRATALDWHPAALAQFADAGYKPTTIMEPGVTFKEKGNVMRLDAYLNSMQEAGVSAEDWGRVVVTPEYIVGDWAANDPEDYVRITNAQLKSFHEHFPGVETTLLIDTADMESKPLIAAIKNSPVALRKDLYDSVGIQAYANSERIQFDDEGKADISNVLSLDHIRKIAQATGKKKIWINTGIVKQDAGLGVEYSVQERMAMADAVADVVAEAQDAGYDVTDVMLFAEDKLNNGSSEGRDFSISEGEEHIALWLHKRLRDLDVKLSGFATYN